MPPGYDAGPVNLWDLTAIETPGGSRSPVVLHSDDEARLVLIGLHPGQELGDHGVKENAYVSVVEGTVEINTGDEVTQAGAGTLFAFRPDERRAISSERGARILMLLAPWPGKGHYRGEERAGG